jgi:DNA-binding NarL/FixJ family response regulator
MDAAASLAETRANSGRLLERTHLLLVDLPRMLREIVTDSLSIADDVVVVGEIDSETLLADAAERDADYVVMGREDAALVAELLRARPSMKVIAIIAHGEDAALYELQPQRVPLGELSRERLVAVIRETASSAQGR